MDPQFVVVTWHDAWGDATSSVTLKDVDETHKPEVIRTAGWLLKDDEQGISLANEVCGDGSYRGRSFIPASLVIAKDVYKLTKAKKSGAGKDKLHSTELPPPTP